MTAIPGPQPDIAFTLLTQLLGHIMDRLTDAGMRPKRSFVYGGGAAPADDCCDGLAWGRVALVQPTDGSGAPVTDIRNASIPAMGHSITLEVGVLRCAPTLDGGGNPPDASDDTAAALQVAADRQQMRMAVLCDFPSDIIAIGADGQAVGPWVPVDAGDCIGGYLTTTVGTSSTMTL